MVLICSPDWTRRQALLSLCIEKGDVPLHVISVFGMNDDISHQAALAQLAIIDVEPRNAALLIFQLRQSNPELKIIMTQRRFLFSDTVVANMFGHIWLIEYATLLSGDAHIALSVNFSQEGELYRSHRLSVICQKSEIAAKYFPDRKDVLTHDSMEAVMKTLKVELFNQLSERLGSRSLAFMTLTYFVKHKSPLWACKALLCSQKTVYYYRKKVMKALGINSYTHEFIPSLSFGVKQLEG